MKLKKLSLANYRGFEQIDIEFEDDVTVIAGVNGVGKTGVLEALAKMFSFALTQFTYSKEKAISYDENDIKLGSFNLTAEAVVEIPGATILLNDALKSTDLPYDQLKEMVITRTKLKLVISNNPASSKEVKDAKDALKYLDFLLDGEANYSGINIQVHDQGKQQEFLSELKEKPKRYLAVFYTTKRFLDQALPTLRSKKAPVSAAYSKALDGGEISLKEFAIWYRAQSSLEKEGNVSSKNILQALKDAIFSFLPDVRDFYLKEGPKPNFIIDKSGEKLFLWQLSDGERGLLALVFDLTRRLAIANPESTSPGKEGTAVVMIDEGELHLHPKWQKTVINSLQTTFPNCQFIITTHSPFIIQSLKQGQLRRIGTPDEDLGEYENQPIDDIAEFIQEVSFSQLSNRAIELNAAVRDYYGKLKSNEASEDELNEAEANFREASKRFSANPGLSAILELEALAMAKKDEK